MDKNYYCTCLALARGRKPKHPKKSFRKAFSCVPTRPVAGEGLSLHLRQKINGTKQPVYIVYVRIWPDNSSTSGRSMDTPYSRLKNEFELAISMTSDLRYNLHDSTDSVGVSLHGAMIGIRLPWKRFVSFVEVTIRCLVTYSISIAAVPGCSYRKQTDGQFTQCSLSLVCDVTSNQRDLAIAYAFKWFHKTLVYTMGQLYAHLFRGSTFDNPNAIRPCCVFIMSIDTWAGFPECLAPLKHFSLEAATTFDLNLVVWSWRF